MRLSVLGEDEDVVEQTLVTNDNKHKNSNKNKMEIKMLRVSYINFSVLTYNKNKYNYQVVFKNNKKTAPPVRLSSFF